MTVILRQPRRDKQTGKNFFAFLAETTTYILNSGGGFAAAAALELHLDAVVKKKKVILC